MHPRFLLDTHIVVRWLTEPKKLSREQNRVIVEEIRHGSRVAVSAISLLEIALLAKSKRIAGGLNQLFHQLDTNPNFQVVPLTVDIAREFMALSDSLRDPSDRVIVATARAGGLRLVTSDQRIIDSGLVLVVE